MIYFIDLKGLPIFQQLQLEEALLRTDGRNFCIVNTQAPPAIVMGISGRSCELVDLEKVKQSPIPIIKRFSGGGTVVIDEETIFLSFLGNISDFSLDPFPQPILEWSEKIYKPLFPVDFHLRENDFCVKDRKIGGNAQYLQKNRFLLHTSFLWNFSKSKMEYLLFPKKRPLYREERSHLDFLTTLSHHFSCKKSWISTWKNHIFSTFPMKELDVSQLHDVLLRPHRQATHLC